MSLPRVSVILVNWNGEKFLADCLRSVQVQDYAGECEVLLVDNGSTDGSLRLVETEFSDVQVFRDHPNNYAAANNFAVGKATGQLVLQLNTDAQLSPNALSELVAALLSHPEAAGVAPRILSPNGRIYSTGIEERSDLYWVDRDEGQEAGDVGAPETVFGISGCCALYRREVWLAVGGLAEDFHMYYEDVDMSLRVRAAGHVLLYCPAVAVTHIGHASIEQTDHGKDPLGERNRLLVLAAHYPESFARECERSPWFASASDAELRAFLPKLLARDPGGKSGLATELVVALRGACKGRPRAELLQKREAWIATLLREVGRLRFYRLPGRRLKLEEREFLDRHDGAK